MSSRQADRGAVRITDARTSLSDDIEARRKRYLISMTIRVLCFVSAYFAHGWLRWVVVAGAVFIPYFAVVIANAGRSLRSGPPLAPVTPGVQQLGSSPTTPSATGATPGGIRGPGTPGDGRGPDGRGPDGRGPDGGGPDGGGLDGGGPDGGDAQWATQTSGSLVHDRTSSGS